MRTNDNVRGLVVKKRKVLLIHRFKYGNEYWVVPGGGVEEGEGLEEALKREIKEETNLDMIDCQFLEAVDVENGTKQHIFVCNLKDGKEKLGGPEKIDNSLDNQYILTWVEIEKVLKLEKIYPKVIKKYLKTK